MEILLDTWSMVVILAAAFVIGWAAEAAQTFIPRALALTILAWLQTLPEFAVEAAIAWSGKRDLMIANLTGSLRLLVGLGWPMIFFVHFFFHGIRHRRLVQEIELGDEDSLSVIFLFISILYFIPIVLKGSLTSLDSVFLILIYIVYLIFTARLPVHDVEDPSDLPWIARKVVALNQTPKVLAVIFLFAIGGCALYVSVHPFIDILQKWAAILGISTFVFIQWVAPFLSEFPEKVSAFNWARQEGKAPMAVMNMVSSNINQWTMLAAMIPLVFSLSLGYFEPVILDKVHSMELILTVAQSALGGLLLLDLRFSIWDATIIFLLWIVQFIYAPLREEVTVAYLIWIAWALGGITLGYIRHKKIPRALSVISSVLKQKPKLGLE